jgi:XTP/dITP diphosphohydrolase
MKLIFATNNLNKVKELNEILKDSQHEILTMAEAGFHEEIEETGTSLEENAIIKVKAIADKMPDFLVFSEDTGLEIQALNHEPGVHTARYAGPARNDDDNMNLVLKKLEMHTDRSARFRTIIALKQGQGLFLFEGIAPGRIANEKRGKGGFGYDPIFIPEGYNISFAELSKEEKAKISHRAKAVEKLIDFLKKVKLT